jgi:hypothetical protein
MTVRDFVIVRIPYEALIVTVTGALTDAVLT